MDHWVRMRFATPSRRKGELACRKRFMSKRGNQAKEENGGQARVTVTYCGKCGAEFACAALDPGTECWCKSFPPVAPPIVPADACVCPACLAAAVEATGIRR